MNRLPFDAYHRWMGIPPEEQPPHHYRLLGVRLFEDDPDVIENASDQRMAHLRSFQTGAHSDQSQRLLNEVAAARVCLLNAKQKAAYDAALREGLGSLSGTSPETEEIESDLADFLRDAQPEPSSPAAEARSRRAKPALPRGWHIWAGGAVCLLVVGLFAIAWRGQRETIPAASISQSPRKTEADGKREPSSLESALPSPSELGDGTQNVTPPGGQETAAAPAAQPPEPKDGEPQKGQAVESKAARVAAAPPEQKPEAKADGAAAQPSPPQPAKPAEGDWIDLLTLADLDLHRVAGDWKRDGEGIAVDGEGVAKFKFPVVLEGSYDLEMKFTRFRNRRDVFVALPAGHGICQLALSAWDGGGHTLAYVNRRDDAGFVRPGTIVNDTPHTVETSVRVTGDEAEIVTRLDGQPCCRWKGDSRQLGCMHAWWTSDWRCPGASSVDNKLTVHQFRVRPVGKQARIVPLEKADQEGPILLPAQGRRIGCMFHESAPAGASLMGLRLWREVPICGLQPIWRGKDGRELLGGFYGRQQGSEHTVKAKDGYAVGGVRMRANEDVAALQLVFMRIRDGALDPEDSYLSPWIGDDNDLPPVSLSGDGRPLTGIYGYSGDPIHSLGFQAARDGKEPTRRFLRLTEVPPLSSQVGWAGYEVNWGGGSCRPILPSSPQFCPEYLFAHAPSRVSYAIPKGLKSFSAVAYCAAPGKLRFQVFADDKRIFSSDKARIAPVLVDLPPRSRVLHLVVDDLGDPGWDHSFWLLPRFHRTTASHVEQLDGASKHVKLTLAIPMAASVAVGRKFLINAVPENVTPPLQVLEWDGCNECCFAHAKSRLVYAIPPGAKGFLAVGYCVMSGDVKFLVKVDGKLAFESPKAGIVPVSVRLPRDAKRMELLVDDCGNASGDQSFWCYPRLWW